MRIVNDAPDPYTMHPNLMNDTPTFPPSQALLGAAGSNGQQRQGRGGSSALPKPIDAAPCTAHGSNKEGGGEQAKSFLGVFVTANGKKL
jgi:hypothetical protein